MEKEYPVQKGVHVAEVHKEGENTILVLSDETEINVGKNVKSYRLAEEGTLIVTYDKKDK